MYTSTDKIPKLCIAEQDIITYKCVIPIFYEPWFLEDSFILKPEINYYESLFKGFIYLPNKEYNTTLEHFMYDNIKRMYQSGAGFYSWENRYKANVKCIIPKGAEYYLAYDIKSDRMIYHSNRIKIVELL